MIKFIKEWIKQKVISKYRIFGTCINYGCWGRTPLFINDRECLGCITKNIYKWKIDLDKKLFCETKYNDYED